MRYRRAQTIAILAAITINFSPASGWSEPSPRLSVQMLTGSPFALPEDLPAGISILVIGFTQKAGDNSRPWVGRLRKDFPSAKGFNVYSVAVLAGVPVFFRPLVVNSIRRGVSPSDQAMFLIAESDESAWRTLAGNRLPDDPCIVALDNAGNVLARASGVFSEQRYREAAALIQGAKTWN